MLYLVCLLTCRFNNMFGVLGILDRVHGTDNLFRQSKSYERHFLSTSLTPVRELIPDAPKPKKAQEWLQ